MTGSPGNECHEPGNFDGANPDADVSVRQLENA
jgi:hypothetical protein